MTFATPSSGLFRYPGFFPVWGLVVWLALNVGAAEPRFSLIEKLNPKLLVVHFDTEPNRSYTVQVAAVPHSTNQLVWRTFFVAPALPFENHYVVADSPTNQQRYYRLLVKP